MAWFFSLDIISKENLHPRFCCWARIKQTLKLLCAVAEEYPKALDAVFLKVTRSSKTIIFWRKCMHQVFRSRPRYWVLVDILESVLDYQVKLWFIYSPSPNRHFGVVPSCNSRCFSDDPNSENIASECLQENSLHHFRKEHHPLTLCKPQGHLLNQLDHSVRT